MKPPKVILWFAEQADRFASSFYGFDAADLVALRTYLRYYRRHHSECRYWLDYYKDFTPSDRPDKDGCTTMDDYEDAVRFGAFCRQLLALNGVVVAA